MEEIFDIEKFNLISDDENYYFFRSLEPGDIEDLENGIIKEGEKYKRLRTDRERWEERHQEKPRWNVDSTVTLEEMFNHIKMHYSLQTNCISLSSNANVARTYGEAFSDKYVMIRVPKKEMGEKVFHAGEYMLQEIAKQVEKRISEGEIPESIVTDLNKIDSAKTSEEIKELIKTKYKVTQKLDGNKAHPNKGITYRSPHTRISSWQSLNEEQTLEKNKIIAKLTILEHKRLMKPVIPHSANNNLLVRTVGNAFASSEQIYYGDIEGNRITDISKEIVDMFGLLQQVKEQDRQIVDELKKGLIRFVNDGKKIEIPEDSILKNDIISIEKMYDLTEGKIEYGQASSIVNKLYYLARGQSKARALADMLKQINNNDSRYEEVIKYIRENGFEIEPKISTRQSNKGYKLSESVNLNLEQDEIKLIEQVKKLSNKEQEEIIQNGGVLNLKEIISGYPLKEKVSKERYYAEAIFSMYDWKKIGIEEFSVSERENLIQRIQEKDCVNLYRDLEQSGIAKKDIPTVLLNKITGKKDELNEDLSIERIEKFLGYYDVPNTEIKLRPYQKIATEKTDEIFEENRFASVILPTGGGKSFVALDQLMKHKEEKMLYLAPQNEILEQMKDYIIKYIHGHVNTLGKSKDEIVAEVFPNLKFATYPSLLSKEGEELLKKQYDFIILDELHRTGSTEWGERLNTLLDNQPLNTKVLGITATPRRDTDGKNMANEIAERLGYTNKEAVSGKHVAMNMSLTNAIKMGIVVNPKLVSCAYSLKTDGSLKRLKEKINQIEDIQIRNEKLKKYETLRRSLDEAEGIADILQSNVKRGGKYIVFLPIIEDIEDEDGNVIGRKKGKEKIVDYEKQIAEYFQGSEITPSFHSMLGEYGDKENERRLEEFQSRNTDDTEFMLVMNKANEGLHLDKLDGMIWFRPMDENSKILYLQQLGRVIYAEDPDNPIQDEVRPIVIDLVNNTIKVNWENEVAEQDDIELMHIVVDWTKKHDGILPDINSNDKEENGYARVLKTIQSKYRKYLENNMEGLNEAKKEEVQKILKLGAELDLWIIELPEKNKKNGKIQVEIFKEKKERPFEIVGILKDFVELENEIDEDIEKKTTYEEVIEFLEKNDGRMMASYISKDGRKVKRSEMTEEQLKEVKLYDRWRKTNEKKILEKYRNQPIENVPEEYRDKITRLREFGLDTRKKTTYEKVIDFLEKNDGRMMSSEIKENGRALRRSEMTEEQIEEINLHSRWNYSNERKILEKYKEQPIENVPEEYRDKITKLRMLIKKKTIYEEIVEFLENHDGRMALGSIKIEGKHLKRSQMTEEQKREVSLYDKWRRSKEKEILEKYAGQPIENIPKEYRDKIAKLREFGLGVKKKTTYEEVIEFLKTHDGRMMSGNFRDKTTGKILRAFEMTKEQQEEVNLYAKWKRQKEKEILEVYRGQPIENVPEEYRNKIAEIRQCIKEKTTYEKVIEFLEKNEGKLMSSHIIIDGKKKKSNEMTEKQNEEVNLYRKWYKSEERKILEKYRGQPIENVPEEYRDRIAKLREFGLGVKPKKKKSAKEIAEVSISAIKDTELADKENKALQELVQKTKEGGIKGNE